MEAGRVGGEKAKPFLRRKDEGEPEVPPVGRQRSLRTRSRKKNVDTGWPSHGSRDRERAVRFPACAGLSRDDWPQHQDPALRENIGMKRRLNVFIWTGF